MKPTIHVATDHDAMSQEAARRILAAVSAKPDLLLCAAGGNSPLGTYQQLAEHRTVDPLAFRSLRVVKLDEWGGLSANDPGSCEHQLRQHLVHALALPEGRYFGFSGDAHDPEAECARVRARLSVEGPIDLCVLGLGTNGHLGMNEPAASLRPFAHVARLAESTLQHPMLAASRVRPTDGLTLGMAEILAAHEILLLVSGAAKREPLRRLFEEGITSQFPASLLWLHWNWTLICDQAAAEGLDLQSAERSPAASLNLGAATQEAAIREAGRTPFSR